MSTPLSVYLANIAASALTTADQLYAVGGSPTSTATYSNLGTSTGYLEITSQGQVTTGQASIGVPSGKGFLLDSILLEGQSLVAGSWGGIIRLNASQFNQAAGTGSTQGGTLVGDLYLRAFKRSSLSIYTPIVTIILTAQTLTGTFVSYTLPATNAAAISFAVGDRLYVDCWFNCTNNTNANSLQGIRLNRLSLDTTNHTGDPAAFISTPGYQVTTTTVGTSSTSITEQQATQEIVTTQQIAVTGNIDAPMFYDDLQQQQLRIQSSSTMSHIALLGITYYPTTTIVSEHILPGEIDILLQGESITQLHTLKTIHQVNDFLAAYP